MSTRIKERTSGIELLRILAMIGIIAHHFYVHSIWQPDQSFTNKYYLECFGSLGRIGVAIFFMITGYFLAKSKKQNWKKVFSILRPTFFYSLLFFFIFLIIGDSRIQHGYPIDTFTQRSFLPISSNSYWFISSYIIVMLLSPYLRKCLDTLKDRDLLVILGIFFFTNYCTLFINSATANIEESILELPVGLFFTIAGYTLSRYEGKFKTKKAPLIGLAISLLLLMAGPLIKELFKRLGHPGMPANIFTCDFAPATILFATSSLLLFSKFQFRSKIINYIAGLTFGIYLIHENAFIRDTLWKTNYIIDTKSHSYDSIRRLIVYSFATVLAIFVISAAIEAVRKICVHYAVLILIKFKQENNTKPEITNKA